MCPGWAQICGLETCDPPASAFGVLRWWVPFSKMLQGKPGMVAHTWVTQCDPVSIQTRAVSQE